MKNSTSFFSIGKRPVWLSPNLVGVSLASIMSDASHEIVPLVLPIFLAQHVSAQAAPTLVALISGCATTLASISGLFAGRLSDHMVRRKPLIVVGYFLAGSFIGLLSFAQQWPAVFVFVAGAWIGRGLVSAPRNALIAESTPPNYVGHAFGFRQACDTLGSVLGPLLVYFLSSWPIHLLFLVALIPAMAAFLFAVFFIHEEPDTLIKVALPKYTLPEQFYWLLGVFLLFGLGGFNKTLLVLRMQELLSSQLSSATLLSTIAVLYIYRNIVQVGASYIMGALSDSVGRIIPLAFGGFGTSMIVALLLGWAPPSVPLAWAIFTLSGISAGTSVTLQKSLAADILPHSTRGLGYGILTVVDSIGNLTASMILGLIWSLIGPQGAFSVTAILSGISIGVLFMFRKKYSA